MNPVKDKPGKKVKTSVIIRISLGLLYLIIILSLAFVEDYESSTNDSLTIRCYNHTDEEFIIHVYDENTRHQIPVSPLQNSEDFSKTGAPKYNEIEYKRKYSQRNTGDRFNIQLLTHDGERIIIEKTIYRPMERTFQRTDDFDFIVLSHTGTLVLDINKNGDGEYRMEFSRWSY